MNMKNLKILIKKIVKIEVFMKTTLKMSLIL